MIGSLASEPALRRPDLLAEPVAAALGAWPAPLSADRVEVAEIDPGLADTAAFCAAYGVAPEESANCVVVAARLRDGTVGYAACVVLATTRADVNRLVRRRLDARKCSFAAMDDVCVPSPSSSSASAGARSARDHSGSGLRQAPAATGMEYGGITPIGLPDGWPVLVDAAVAASALVVVGSGLRRSKLALPGATLAAMPSAEVLEGLGLPAA